MIHSDHDLIIEIHTNVKRLIRDSQTHEERITGLEKFRYNTMGALVIIGALITYIIGVN